MGGAVRIQPEISEVGIVLLGTINPAIFTPAWFAMHDLLPKAAAENAQLGVAHPQLSVFATEWLQLNVAPDRFQATTREGPYVRLRDLVVRVFREHLPHTPVTVVGINRNVHFRAPSLAARDRVGKKLAPFEPWGAVGERLGFGTEKGGMVSITMRQNDPPERPVGGQVNVTVEPSVPIGNAPAGIYVAVNDHYQARGTSPEDRAELFDCLEDDFEQSIHRADSIVNHVMALASGAEEVS